MLTVTIHASNICLLICGTLASDAMVCTYGLRRFSFRDTADVIGPRRRWPVFYNDTDDVSGVVISYQRKLRVAIVCKSL
jgi:hypothetical protein